jgi:hypothetical protein
MNKPIYGLTGFSGSPYILTPDQIPTCSPTPGAATLSPLQLTIYLNRANALLNAAATYREPIDTTLNRLDVIRQEICVLTGRTYQPLPPPPEVGIATATTDKITITSNIP